jgi:purine-binding chemotaxis protein CheW
MSTTTSTSTGPGAPGNSPAAGAGGVGSPDGPPAATPRPAGGTATPGVTAPAPGTAGMATPGHGIAGTPATDTPTSSQLVVLRLGREEYALPIDHVQEIIFWSPPRPVSSDLPWVSGVIALRGKILPVFDLALRLDVPRGDGGARIVVVETGTEQIGVTVDDATEVLTVEAGDLEALPQGTGHDLLRAITKVGDRLIAVLDLSTLAASAHPALPADAVATAR